MLTGGHIGTRLLMASERNLPARCVDKIFISMRTMLVNKNAINQFMAHIEKSGLSNSVYYDAYTLGEAIPLIKHEGIHNDSILVFPDQKEAFFHHNG